MAHEVSVLFHCFPSQERLFSLRTLAGGRLSNLAWVFPDLDGSRYPCELRLSHLREQRVGNPEPEIENDQAFSLETAEPLPNVGRLPGKINARCEKEEW